MRCSIPCCRNSNTINQTSSDKLTFHVFPKDPKQRAAWVESLAIPNWTPKNKSVACSAHFKENDFNVTANGIRRVKAEAVPVITDDCMLAAARVCKLCLTMDAKMYQIRKKHFCKMYLDIIGIPPRSDPRERLPMGICWECAARLRTAASFKSKALFCDSLLQQHLMTCANIKLGDIRRLYKQHPYLGTNLKTQEVFKFNSENLNEHAPKTLVKTELVISHEQINIEVNRLIDNQPEHVEIEEDNYVINDEDQIDTQIPVNKVEIAMNTLSNQIPHNHEVEIEVNNLITNRITIKDEHRNEIVEDTLMPNDIKTEIDMIPLTEMEINDKIDDLVSEQVFVKAIDSGAVNLNFGNDDFTVIHDDDGNDNDAGGNDNDAGGNYNDADASNDVVACVEVKTKDVKGKKKPVEKKLKKPVGEDVTVWVKGRRRKKRQPYVKPCTPIDDNIFTVKPLTHEYMMQEILDRKNSERYQKAPFKCDVCYSGFPTQDKQSRHMLKHSEQNGPIKCVICHVRMNLERQMRSHMKQKHTADYICKLCPLVTRNRNVALGHMKFHAGDKFICPQCSMEFERQTTLLNHLRLKHISDCVCELCGYTFVSKFGVKSHKRMKHNAALLTHIELKGPFCEVCDVKFFNQKAFDRHMRLSSKHISSEHDPLRLSNDPSIKSRRIGAVMMRRSNRRPIIRRKDANAPLHNPNSPVTCEQCGLVLESLRSYAAHFRHSHPEANRTQFTSMTIPYMCEHCGKMFLNSTTLAGHMWVHTGEKRFQCDHCNKTFSMKANLAGHMKQHQPVRVSYSCRVCGKQFAFSHNLTRHMFVHSGLRPFKCEACEKTFRTKGELRSHIDYVHLNKPRPKRVRRRAKKCDVPSLEY